MERSNSETTKSTAMSAEESKSELNDAMKTRSKYDEPEAALRLKRRLRRSAREVEVLN